MNKSASKILDKHTYAKPKILGINKGRLPFTRHINAYKRTCNTDNRGYRDDYPISFSRHRLLDDIQHISNQPWNNCTTNNFDNFAPNSYGTSN